MARMMKNIRDVSWTFFPQQTMMVMQTESTSDDMKVIKQISAAHSPDANFNVNEQALLNMAQDILNKANPTFPPPDQKIDPKVLEEGITGELVFTIQKIGCELSCNCSGGADLKLVTAVFDTLVKYSWEDKLAIALLAFAVNYGDSCLPMQVAATNPLAKYLVQLHPLSDISGQKALINNLMNVVIDVTKSIIKLNKLHSQYISHDKPPLSQAKISTDVYWAIRGIVACSSRSIGRMNMGNQYWGKITEACIMYLIPILESRHRNLTEIWHQCINVIKEKETEEAYYKLKEFMKRPHTDNVEVLFKLIHTEDNTPLFHRDAKKKESLDVLRSKAVILFFSYYDISDEEIKEIEQKIWKTDQRPYEIVWLPVLYKQEISDEMKEVIDKKARLMPWYSLHYSLTLHPFVIKYIKKHWKFGKKALLVGLNEQGNVNSCNVYDMIMTWEFKAYPFDDQTEKDLWNNFKWRLGFFVDEELVKEGKLIYLYGGDDCGWIEKFISTMKKLVKGDMKLIYVGKEHRETIKNGNLVECWDDQKIMRFWARMYSVLYYKTKSVASIDTDKAFKDVLTLLGAEGSRKGWAIIGHGSDNMVALNGETIAQLLVQLNKLDKVPITIQDFFIELDKFKPTTREPHCNHIYVTSTNGIIQENMICVDCRCPMEKQVVFTCCKNV